MFINTNSMFSPRASSFSIWISFTLLTMIKHILAQQQTFYYEDENIRFYQVTLIPANGISIVANQSIVTFTKPTDFIDNVSNTEMALCGFSLENQMNMEYSASVKYTSGLFTFTVQTYNQTQIQYISFYAILYTTKATTYFQSRSLCLQCQILSQNPNKNRTQQMNITMVTNRTSGSNFYVKALIRSMKTRQGGNGYTRLQAAYSYWDMFTTKLVVMLSTYESVVTQACVTVVALSYAMVGANYTYLMTDFTVRQFLAASIKSAATNFGISSTIYGPIFNKKCLIGFQNIYFRDGVKQIYFDATKTGIQSLTQNTPQYFYAEISIYCVTRQKICAFNQGIQTGLQQCVNCSLMIKNCAYCLTESECTSCATGYFIDKSKKCCPTYLTNCSVCSLSNTCSQCVDGFYTSQVGSCALCSTAVTNCYRCANSTFCYQCKDGYTTQNFTSCKLTGSSSTNTTTNTTSNSTTDTTTNTTTNNSTSNNTDPNNNNNNPTTEQSSGMSLWMILFIAIAGAFALMLLIMIFVCVKWKKNHKDKDQHMVVVNSQNHNPNDGQLSNGMSNNHPHPTSMENNKLTTNISPYGSNADMINQSQLKPGSGLDIRCGSKFQSYFTNCISPYQKTFINNQKVPTKDINSINSINQKSTNHKNPNSLISSGMQKSNEVKDTNQFNEVKNQPQTDRVFLKKDSSFLPQNSKNSMKFGGSIHLKANYYK